MIYRLLIGTGAVLFLLGEGLIMAIGVPESTSNLSNPDTRLWYTLSSILLTFLGGTFMGMGIVGKNLPDKCKG